MKTQTANLTKSDLLKSRIIAGFSELLAIHKDDVESGISEGIYNANENVKTLRWIEKMEKAIDAFSKYKPTIYVYVEGGNVQGASADCGIQFEIYDKDNLEAGTTEDEKDYIENHGTLQEWDNMITTLTNRRVLRPVY